MFNIAAPYIECELSTSYHYWAPSFLQDWLDAVEQGRQGQNLVTCIIETLKDYIEPDYGLRHELSQDAHVTGNGYFDGLNDDHQILG